MPFQFQVHGPGNKTIVLHRESDLDCYVETKLSGRTMVNTVDVHWTVPVLVVNSNDHVLTLPARIRMASVTQVTLIQNINVQQKGVDP